MDSASLDKKIAARVKKFNFGAKKGVLSIVILYANRLPVGKTK